MTHIFISYSKQDITFVRYLRALLTEQRFNVWVDEAQIDPSVRWWKTIEQNIDSCTAFIVVMSPYSLESDWVEREILRAEHQKRPIYPILLAGEPWSRLANIQYEDMRAGIHAKLSQHFVRSLQAVAHHVKENAVCISVEQSDILDYRADAIALKHAQEFFGADYAVALALTKAGLPARELAVPEGDFRYLQTGGTLGAANALFVGTPSAMRFSYSNVRELSVKVLSALMEVAPETKHLAMTTHGIGFGLDETESFLAQFAGYIDAFQARQFPEYLEHISIVERDADRVERLRYILESNLANVSFAERVEHGWNISVTVDAGENKSVKQLPTSLDSAGAESSSRRHVYVALQGDETMDDVFYYGIQGAVHAFGLLCERIEGKDLGEELLNQIRQRINTAAVVIGELTHPDPMIYLQVGYAWGQGRPTILVAQHPHQPMFETAQCIQYHKIKDLEQALSQVLDGLKAEGAF